MTGILIAVIDTEFMTIALIAITRSKGISIIFNRHLFLPLSDPVIAPPFLVAA
ncbi:hypothetical protein [Methylomarinum vadi]|uniref:hypothetical protein n=1 Tax=Methylomarinum vadi TaxID=438855 RepID=UPI001364812D|nr:hypothetical protein [Methylomarinum vadi]